MKVASPVGEFPYTFDRFRIQRRSLVIDGHMGAWPARIELRAGDLRPMFRPLRRQLLVLGGLVALLVLRGYRGRRSAPIAAHRERSKSLMTCHVMSGLDRWVPKP